MNKKWKEIIECIKQFSFEIWWSKLALLKGFRYFEISKSLLMMIVFGFFYSFVMRFMLVPSNLYIGGLTGFTQAIIYVIIPPGAENDRSTYFFIAYIILNIPFLIFSWFKIGKIFTINTIVFLVSENLWNLLWVSSTFDGFEILKQLLHLSVVVSGSAGSIDVGQIIGIYFYAFFGGVLLALTLAPIYHNNACHGGSNIYATYLAIKKRKSIGAYQRLISVIVVFFAVILDYAVHNDGGTKSFLDLFFNNPIFVASLISTFTSSAIFNLLYRDLKIVFVQVISKNCDSIIAQLGQMHNITHYLKSLTVYDIRKQRDKESFFTIVTFREYKIIKKLIIKTEPSALIFAFNVSHFRGKVKYAYIK